MTSAAWSDDPIRQAAVGGRGVRRCLPSAFPLPQFSPLGTLTGNGKTMMMQMSCTCSRIDMLLFDWRQHPDRIEWSDFDNDKRLGSALGLIFLHPVNRNG